jgi:hypothetical protein
MQVLSLFATKKEVESAKPMNPVIDCYVRYIPKRNPLRRIAVRLLYREVIGLCREPIGSADKDVLLSALRYPTECRWRHRIVAAWALQQTSLTPDERAGCLSTLYSYLQQPDRIGRRVYLLGKQIIGYMLPVGLGLTFLFMFAYQTGTDQFFDIFVPLFLVSILLASPFLLIMFGSQWANRDTQLRVAFIELLDHLQEPLSIGALATAACSSHLEVSAEAKRVLANLLPDLTIEHYGQLPSTTVPHLCDLIEGKPPLFTHPAPWMVQIVLDALEKIGDSRAIPTVRNIAEGHYFASHVCTATGDEANREIQRIRSCERKAQRILPILLERYERERHSGMLLRAASPPETTPEELLRPAAEATATAPEQLLRASATDASRP